MWMAKILIFNLYSLVILPFAFFSLEYRERVYAVYLALQRVHRIVQIKKELYMNQRPEYLYFFGHLVKLCPPLAEGKLGGN